MPLLLYRVLAPGIQKITVYTYVPEVRLSFLVKEHQGEKEYCFVRRAAGGVAVAVHA